MLEGQAVETHRIWAFPNTPALPFSVHRPCADKPSLESKKVSFVCRPTVPAEGDISLPKSGDKA